MSAPLIFALIASIAATIISIITIAINLMR